jgi:hypothetical protein
LFKWFAYRFLRKPFDVTNLRDEDSSRDDPGS